MFFILFAEGVCFDSNYKVNHPEVVVFLIRSHLTSLPSLTYLHYLKNSAHIQLQGQALRSGSQTLTFRPYPSTLLCILYTLSPDSSLWHASISCLRVSSCQNFHGMSSLISLSSFQVADDNTLSVEPLHLHSEGPSYFHRATLFCLYCTWFPVEFNSRSLICPRLHSCL